jgi:hypothetical protein
MNKEENREFVQKTESLVKPQDVTAISFLGDFNKILPKKTQHKIMERGSRTIPYMGFIVDPYCFFLSYRIKNTAAAQSMLPSGYELADASIFSGEEKHPLVIISAFSVRTSAFMGTRLEFYIIARNKETGLMSWIIADYETNTNSHDPKNGFCGYTSDPSILTTTPYGELLIEFRARGGNDTLSVRADLKKGTLKDLDRELWIEGNMSVDYRGKLLDQSSKPFSLIFDPKLMQEAVRIPYEAVDIMELSYMSELIDYDKPLSTAVFPYSQHFIIKQHIQRNELTRESDLYPLAEEFLNKTDFKTMSGKDLKKSLLIGFILSSVVNLAVILFLLLKLLL